jgi:hypothetical protein
MVFMRTNEKRGYSFYTSLKKMKRSLKSFDVFAVSAVTVTVTGPNPTMRPVFIVIVTSGGKLAVPFFPLNPGKIEPVSVKLHGMFPLKRYIRSRRLTSLSIFFRLVSRLICFFPRVFSQRTHSGKRSPFSRSFSQR